MFSWNRCLIYYINFTMILVFIFPSMFLVITSQRVASQPQVETEVLFKSISKDQAERSRIRDLPPEWSFVDFLHCADYYVDKTLLLREIFANESYTNMIITAPPKWGKTLTLRMIEFFLNLQIGTNYQPVPVTETVAYKFFTEGKLASYAPNSSEIRFTKPPLISRYPKFIAEHLARYHVIYLDFGEFGPMDTFHRFFTRFRTTMTKIFVRFTYARMVMERELDICKAGATGMEAGEIDNLIGYLISKFERHLDVDNMEEGDWINCLVHLTKMLNEFYDEKVILLVDNHDYFMNMIPRMRAEHVERVVEFAHYFVQSAFYDNLNVHKSLFSGVLPIVMGDITANVSLKDYLVNSTRKEIIVNATDEEKQTVVAKPVQEGDANFTDKSFVYLGNIRNELYPFYGFTEPEFRQIFDYFDIPDDLYDKAVRRYGGFFNGTVMNPMSVSKFSSKRVISDYWADEKIVDIDDLKINADSPRLFNLRRLMRDHCVPYEFATRLPLMYLYGDNATVIDVRTGQRMIGKPGNYNGTKNEDDFFLYLLAKGILTTDSANDALCLRIPNEENKSVIRKRFPKL